MGNVSDSRQQILLNTLDNEISQYFDVSPGTNVSSGELPLVEDVFQLQIVEEDGDTQLSLRWTSGNERKVETDYCEGCKTIELNGKLVGLVGKLVGGKNVEEVRVVEKRRKGILFDFFYDSEYVWLEDGDEKRDRKYVGEIVNGEPNGHGTYTYGKGEKWKEQKYVGEWKDGKEHGQGTTTFPNGDKYVGEYKDGEENGIGTYTWTDGTNYVGEYKDGKRWDGTMYYTNGNFFRRFVNGVRQ